MLLVIKARPSADDSGAVVMAGILFIEFLFSRSAFLIALACSAHRGTSGLYGIECTPTLSAHQVNGRAAWYNGSMHVSG